MSALRTEVGVPLPGMPPNLHPERGQYAWQPAFLAFCKGFTLEQISQVYQIPQRKLEARALDEHWAALAGEMQPQAKVGQRASDLRVSVERLEQNRTTNYRVWTKLRACLEEKVDLLQKGELRIEKIFHSARTGETARVEAEPTPADIVALANAAKAITEGTYRALGDVVSVDEVAKKNTAPQIGQISIFLPSMIAAGNSKPAPWDTAKQADAVEVEPAKLEEQV